MRPVRNIALLTSALVLAVAIIALFDTQSAGTAGSLSTSIAGFSLHEKKASSVPRPHRRPRPLIDTPTATAPPQAQNPQQAPIPDPPPALPTAAPPAWSVQMAEQVLELVNALRNQAGCGPVHGDDRLQQAATDHSADMASNNYFDHTARDGRSPWDRANAADYPKPTGENIAQGYQSATAVVDGWMNSPGHRDNILNCESTATGLGVVKAANGTPYWTQMFGAQ